MSSSKVQNLTELAEAPASGDLLIVWDVSENDGDGTPGKPKKITSANAHAGYQPLDALLTAIAALSMVADRYIYGTGTDTVALGTITAFARTLLDDVDQAAARTTLALTPGTDVQAYSAQLAAIAALSPSNDDIIQRKAGAWTNRTIAQLLSDLGLSALYQPLDTDLTAIAALVSAANKIAYATGAGTWALTDFTAFARTLLDDADDTTARATLGLGASATLGAAAKLRFVIDGNGSAITTGAKKAYLTVPWACTITAWTILGDQSGSIVFDLWKDSYANYPPTVADTITASAKPTLTTATKATSTTLTGWTTSVSAGDVLEANVDSVSTLTKAILELDVTRTG